jgi:hypothetical protein
VDARVGRALVPAVEVGLRQFQNLEAQYLEGFSVRGPARRHLALAIGTLHAGSATAPQCCAGRVERIERGS